MTMVMVVVVKGYGFELHLKMIKMMNIAWFWVVVGEGGRRENLRVEKEME